MTTEESRSHSHAVPRPVVLCVLDGWGAGEPTADNAIAQASTPVWDGLLARCPHNLLATAGPAVGLPEGQMGNSEVGHMNIGAGRVAMQDLPRIDAAIKDGSLASNETFVRFIAKLKASGGTCHLLGLLSTGGVHSHQDHMAALARVLDAAGIPVAVHAFLDGRDTGPVSGRACMAAFAADIAPLSGVRIASLCGRYWAMDRDSRWDRVARAWRLLVSAESDATTSADGIDAAIGASYAAGTTDEFFEPHRVDGYTGMADGDGLLMANFRADRVREILGALLDPSFDGFTRTVTSAFAAALGMCEYSSALNAHLGTMFRPIALPMGLGEVVAAAGLTQLRIAETEKYAHVTFFLNGGEEQVLPGEDRILVPSPDVATYDLKPEMSANEVTDRLVGAVSAGTYDLIIVNYANTDMVGHTGKFEAACAAVEAVDTCLGRLVDAVETAGGALLITADHGNAESMVDAATGGAQTAHTYNPVPVVAVGGGPQAARLRAGGCLADIAPTLLQLLGLPAPVEMTGTSLIGSGSGGETNAASS